MTNINIQAPLLFALLFLGACSTILEPVLFKGKIDKKISANTQEEFVVNIKSLNFKSAKEANKDPYPRQLMITGSGNKAGVVNEADYLVPKIPNSLLSLDYRLGYGDQLYFTSLHEFIADEPQWPPKLEKTAYILGTGDKLTFITQATDLSNTLRKKEENIIVTDGYIGSNGNVLLLGVGNLSAANKTLNNLRTEVRNILIRNGTTPNFQLEISEFNSQKAYLNVKKSSGEILPVDKVIPILSLPISLKEIALNVGLTESLENSAIITLTRDNQDYRMTAGQLFDTKVPQIYLQNNDQIEVVFSSIDSISTEVVVGFNGNILLPIIGSINVVNRTLKDLQNDIHNKFVEEGLNPKFQLEITNTESKKAYLIQKNVGSAVIPLRKSNITLKELLLTSQKPDQTSNNSLTVITLTRNNEKYRMTGEQLIALNAPNIWIQDKDQIEIENLAYKPGQVYALSGAGSAQIIPIDPSKRETLADILFVPGGAFGNVLAKRSEVYLIRGRKPLSAFHLDARNASRILVGAKIELRPSDIIYIAERPIISFARTLAEINPLRVLLRDLQEGDIP
ncbi:polysaccharide biosynthesis/export family protein [Amylibacter sp.]|nr:polysaccharide biosynthesis/export family protein [Amylibacter sp.]